MEHPKMQGTIVDAMNEHVSTYAPVEDIKITVLKAQLMMAKIEIKEVKEQLEEEVEVPFK